MNIKMKYKIGQELFVLRRTGNKTTVGCKHCDNTGSIVCLCGLHKHVCPICKGRGKKRILWLCAWTVIKEKITEIDIELIGRRKPYFNYVLGGDSLDEEEPVFLSKKLALVECESRNMKEGIGREQKKKKKGVK